MPDDSLTLIEQCERDHPEAMMRARLGQAQRILRDRAKSARHAGQDDPDSYGSAALRGKARGYEEAADLIESVLRGGGLRAKWLRRRHRPSHNTGAES